MPERKSRKNKERNSSTSLRRSPRFLHEDPKTPEPKKIRALRFSTPPSSLFKPPKKCEASSAKGERRRAGSKISVKSSKGHAKYARNDPDLHKQYVIEKMVTKSSTNSKCVNNQVTGCDLEEGSREKNSHFSKLGKDKVVVDRHKQCTGNIEKRVTRSSTQTEINQVAMGRNGSSEAGHKKVMSDEGKAKRVVELSRPCVSETDKKECGVERANGNEKCARKSWIGEKRKRDHVVKESKTVRGWTDEQEAALRGAYFTAKPTPHFWKKVSKMVPGKSAEECFERIHSDHRTPPQPNTRSTAKTKPSSLSFSTSNLLSPAKTKTKRVRSTKQNCLLAQKTVRQLLQKQHIQEKNHEADLFSVLEPTINPCSLNFGEGTPFSSPSPDLGSRSLSSSAHKKQRSRLSVSNNAAFVSPPVLKQVKNKALHEKYIDQLHYRNAKRKKVSLRNGKQSQAADKKESSCVEMKSVKFAKDALIFEAQDAISQFRNLQSSITYDMVDVEDNSCQSDEDEDEDEL